MARELRRHISPKPLVSPFATQRLQQQQPQSSPMGGQQHRMVFIGCTALTIMAGCAPLLLYYWVKPLNESDVPLTAPQIRRGAFQNSGSKDVGKDTDWNFQTGTHKLRAGYGNILNTDNNDNDSTRTDATDSKGKPNTLPAEFLAMAPNDLKKVEEKIEAFAKGRGRNN